MGRSYVIDHCMAALLEEQKERNYRVYVTDCLRTISKNTAIMAASWTEKEDVSYIDIPYRDLLDYDRKPKGEKTSEEIISEIMADLGEKEVEAE